jgi:hypothetical protein
MLMHCLSQHGCQVRVDHGEPPHGKGCRALCTLLPRVSTTTCNTSFTYFGRLFLSLVFGLRHHSESSHAHYPAGILSVCTYPSCAELYDYLTLRGCFFPRLVRVSSSGIQTLWYISNPGYCVIQDPHIQRQGKGRRQGVCVSDWYKKSGPLKEITKVCKGCIYPFAWTSSTGNGYAVAGMTSPAMMHIYSVHVMSVAPFCTNIQLSDCHVQSCSFRSHIHLRRDFWLFGYFQNGSCMWSGGEWPTKEEYIGPPVPYGAVYPIFVDVLGAVVKLMSMIIAWTGSTFCSS